MRERDIFWSQFKEWFGEEPGARPESYWRPWLGQHLHVSPSDIGRLTPMQLYGCHEYLID